MRRTITRGLLGLAVAAMFAMPNTAQAETFPVDGGTVLGFGSAYAAGTHVYVQYLGFDAYYTDNLSFLVGWGGSEYFLFSNKTTSEGDVFSLNDMIGGGFEFTPGSEVVFAMYVSSPTGNQHDDRKYYTGDASRNPDGKDHALWGTYAGTGDYDGNTISFDHQIGFEDLFGGGDKDYNDLVFATSGVSMAVPEPMSMLLMATGLLGISGVAFRRKERDSIDEA